MEGEEHSSLYMQNMTSIALEDADLSFERAFAIDESNIARSVPDYSFLSLVEKFYKKVYDDATLRPFFSPDIERNISNLSDYLFQRCGGSTFYSDRQGIPNIPMRHQDLVITRPILERWLELMEESLDDSDEDFSEDQRQQILDFLRFTGFYIMVWGKTCREHMAKGSMF